MLQEDLSKPLLAGLAPAHILQAGVQPLVGLDKVLYVPNQLLIFRFIQSKIKMHFNQTKLLLFRSLHHIFVFS